MIEALERAITLDRVAELVSNAPEVCGDTDNAKQR